MSTELKSTDKANLTCCAWQGCDMPGTYPAPKSRQNIKERDYFCLQHIREYNKAWDFFKGMTLEQVYDFQIKNVTGHRPTWKMGVSNADYNTTKEIYSKLFLNKKKAARQSKGASSSQIPQKVHECLKILNLRYPVDMKNIKKSYKILAKQYHPDLNNSSSEEQIKIINQAYNYLKNSDLFV